MRVGSTDGTMTEVQGPELKEGMEVIVGTSMNAGGALDKRTPIMAVRPTDVVSHFSSEFNRSHWLPP